jgi:hypothetical protein
MGHISYQSMLIMLSFLGENINIIKRNSEALLYATVVRKFI